MYELPPESVTAASPGLLEALDPLVRGVRDNGALVVVHTTPGAARRSRWRMDQARLPEVLGNDRRGRHRVRRSACKLPRVGAHAGSCRDSSGREEGHESREDRPRLLRRSGHLGAGPRPVGGLRLRRGRAATPTWARLATRRPSPSARRPARCDRDGDGGRARKSSRRTSASPRCRRTRSTRASIRSPPRSSRPLIASTWWTAARKHGATAVAHGATGKGNDQVRFDLAVKGLGAGR